MGLDEAAERVLRSDHPALLAQMEAACVAAATRVSRRAAFLTSAEVPVPKRLRAAIALLEEDADDPLGLAPTLAVLATELQALEIAVAARASVLATTLTRAVTSALSRTLRPTTVIIDEASTAPLVTAFAAAALATRRVVAVGDFLQLAPIVSSPAPLARRWLGTHVFASAGCDQVALRSSTARLAGRAVAHAPADRGGGQPQLLWWALARRRGAGRPARRRPRDRSGRHGATTASSASGASGSKLNPVHADLVVDLAIEAAAHREVAIIAPYRAQVQRIRRLLRGRARRAGWTMDGSRCSACTGSRAASAAWCSSTRSRRRAPCRVFSTSFTTPMPPV